MAGLAKRGMGSFLRCRLVQPIRRAVYRPVPGRANARRIYTVRRSVLSVAVGVLALAAAGPGFTQINTGGFAPIVRGNFNLAEAYPATSGGYTGASPLTIAPNGCWDPSQFGLGGEANPTVQAPTVDNRCASAIALQ